MRSTKRQKTLALFLEKKYQTYLHNPQADGSVLNSFAAFWAKNIDWFEEPNVRRGGWSGVGKMDIVGQDDKILPVFVKKQQNHGRLTLRHPFKGEPTFRREFANLRFLAEKNFLAPEVVFYAESMVEAQPCAVLVTRSLEAFLPLDNALKDKKLHHRAFVESIAQEVRRFHDLGLMHRALYPKHIFVSITQQVKVATIDMEKARHVVVPFYATFFDLAALNRHTKNVRNTLRMRFFLTYMKIERLNFWSKILLRILLKRSLR